MKKPNLLIFYLGPVLADLAEVIETCGMFKLYKNHYLSGVKKFETVKGSLQECMETCCNSRELYEDFDCHSFSYSHQSNYCQLMEEKTTAKMQETSFYNFYLREPLVAENALPLSSTCFAKRYRAFQWHWENSEEEEDLMSDERPYIPECDPESGEFLQKQCQTVWDEKRNS